MEIQIIKKTITKAELVRMAHEGFGELVKAVVDIEQGIMAIGGGLHADEEVVLTEQEHSKREHTWGINIYPEKSCSEFIEFDSMINLKPWLNNRSRGVEDATIREKIKSIVHTLILI
ncbi:MAG: DUF5674 family protein [Patescibacteria group bacterium]